MTIQIMIAKLHGLRVTGAELHYEGSIALDPDHFERVGIVPFQFVEIWNKASGARISTYVIPGERGSRACILNGAAARTCQVGDELIIAARTELSHSELAAASPRILLFREGNYPTEFLQYRFVQGEHGSWNIERSPTSQPRAISMHS